MGEVASSAGGKHFPSLDFKIRIRKCNFTLEVCYEFSALQRVFLEASGKNNPG